MPEPWILERSCQSVLKREKTEAESDNTVQMYAEIERHLWRTESLGRLVGPSHTKPTTVLGPAAAVVKTDLKTVPAQLRQTPRRFRWTQTSQDGNKMFSMCTAAQVEVQRLFKVSDLSPRLYGDGEDSRFAPDVV